jgi:hypothetical protein
MLQYLKKIWLFNKWNDKVYVFERRFFINSNICILLSKKNRDLKIEIPVFRLSLTVKSVNA